MKRRILLTITAVCTVFSIVGGYVFLRVNKLLHQKIKVLFLKKSHQPQKMKNQNNHQTN